MRIGLRAAAIAIALALAPNAADALTAYPPQPNGAAWPTLEWSYGPAIGADIEAIAEDVEKATRNRDPKFGETRAVIIVQNGRIVLEKYAPGFSATTRLVSWSMAKSITQAAVGVAAAQGKLDPNAAMGEWLWPKSDPRAAITWRQWLNMVDGLKYLEIEAPSVAESDAAKQLYGPGRLDVARYCAGLKLASAPGTSWNYNTCGINLVGASLARVISPGPDAAARRAATAEWLGAALFGPIGMTTAQPEFDETGSFLGGSLVYATAQDFARFGLLYLRGGRWDDKQIVPRGWVDFARTPTPATNIDSYGAGWWLTPAKGEGEPLRSLIVGGPIDAFSAQGHEGQVILVVPSKDLVIVRLGRFDDRRGAWDALGDWLGVIARKFPDAAPASPAR
jgi:CubicO group peptidase (beta-lactamase class C family)